TIMLDNLWYFMDNANKNIANNQKSGYHKVPGIMDGTAGVLYLIARAKLCGINVDLCVDNFTKGWEYLIYEYISSGDVEPGFYSGAAGIALALNWGIRSGLIEDNSDHRGLMLQLLDV